MSKIPHPFSTSPAYLIDLSRPLSILCTVESKSEPFSTAWFVAIPVTSGIAGGVEAKGKFAYDLGVANFEDIDG